MTTAGTPAQLSRQAHALADKVADGLAVPGVDAASSSHSGLYIDVVVSVAVVLAAGGLLVMRRRATAGERE